MPPSCAPGRKSPAPRTNSVARSPYTASLISPFNAFRRWRKRSPAWLRSRRSTKPRAATISNLAMAQLRRLPPGTLPPVVLKFDASALPVCLVTFKGEGLNETALRDLAQYNVRNQIASVPGAAVPQPFGGRYRQIMVYTDPYKLEAHQLSLMDVVRAVNDANLILPAGDVQIGDTDYNIYTNSQLSSIPDI